MSDSLTPHVVIFLQDNCLHYMSGDSSNGVFVASRRARVVRFTFCGDEAPENDLGSNSFEKDPAG